MIGNDSRHPGAGFFEAKFSPLMVNDPDDGVSNSKINTWFGNDESRFSSRLAAARQLDSGFAQKYNVKNVRAYSDMYDDAVRMMKSEELRAFDLSQETDQLRERYGRESSFGQGCLLARRLVEHGVRHVEVSFGNWDTHNANFIRVPELCEELDAALSALLQDLEAKGRSSSSLPSLDALRKSTRTMGATTIRKRSPVFWRAEGSAGARPTGKKTKRASTSSRTKWMSPPSMPPSPMRWAFPSITFCILPAKGPSRLPTRGSRSPACSVSARRSKSMGERAYPPESESKTGAGVALIVVRARDSERD
jgi:hypothetical protein